MAAALDDIVVRLEAVTSRLESLFTNTNIRETEKVETVLETTEKLQENSQNPELNSEVLNVAGNPAPS